MQRIDPVERLQMIEMDDVILQHLGTGHQVADQLAVRRHLDAERILHGAHRRQSMDQRANAANSLRKGPGIARIAAAQDDLDAAHLGAGAERLDDIAAPSTSTSIRRWPSIRVIGSMTMRWFAMAQSLRLSATSSSRLATVLFQFVALPPCSSVWRQPEQLV